MALIDNLVFEAPERAHSLVSESRYGKSYTALLDSANTKLLIADIIDRDSDKWKEVPNFGDLDTCTPFFFVDPTNWASGLTDVIVIYLNGTTNAQGDNTISLFRPFDRALYGVWLCVAEVITITNVPAVKFVLQAQYFKNKTQRSALCLEIIFPPLIAAWLNSLPETDEYPNIFRSIFEGFSFQGEEFASRLSEEATQWILEAFAIDEQHKETGGAGRSKKGKKQKTDLYRHEVRDKYLRQIFERYYRGDGGQFLKTKFIKAVMKNNLDRKQEDMYVYLYVDIFMPSLLQIFQERDTLKQQEEEIKQNELKETLSTTATRAETKAETVDAINSIMRCVPEPGRDRKSVV